MKDHTVRQGDCTTSIAFENGFFWETIWNYGANQALKEKRKDPFTLQPDDVVHVPDIRNKQHDCAIDQRHRFRLRGVPSKIQVRLLTAEEKPRSNLAYLLVIDGVPFEGSTDGDGRLQHPIPPNAKAGKLTIPATGEQFDLDLGYLEPIDTVPGVQGRLRNLGFYRGPVDGQESVELAGGIQDFQMAMGLDPLGAMDEKTRAKLKELYGG
jgi:N-acetylmuramoyl-L-alanine amidase